MVNLREVGFIEERQDDKNRKEKTYRIPEKSETAFRFYADPLANPDANMVPGGPRSGPVRRKISSQTLLKNF
jgi:hypothetical protein